MVKIAYTNLLTSAFDNIHTILDTRSNIADPRDKSNTKTRTFVYDSDPFEKSLGYEGMPYIVHTFPKLDTFDKVSSDSKHKEANWSHSIIVRTVREGSSNSYTDAGKTDMLNICDDILQTFNSSTIKSTLSLLNIRNINIQILRSSSALINQKEVFETEFELTHYTRLPTSL